MDYSQLTYRELQQEAKNHGIVANKKKDELVKLLTKHASEVKDPQNQPIFVTEEVFVESKFNEGESSNTTNTTGACQEPSVLASKSPDISIDETYGALHQEEEEASLQDLEIQIPSFERLSLIDQTNFNEKFEDSSNNLIRLKGLPTPSGVKTVFDEIVDSISSKIIWQSPQKLQEPSLMQVPNKHIVFLSPELDIGNKTHWRYEDYDIENQCHNSVNQIKEQNEKSFKQKELATPSKSKEFKELFDHGSAVKRNEAKIGYWLSKSGLTPAKV